MRQFCKHGHLWVKDQRYCKPCRASRKYVQRRQAKRQLVLNELKARPCMDCRLSFPPECMDYDHRPGTVKVRALVEMKSYSMERMLAEIAKCDLVCANCHRIRTKARRKQS